MSSPMVGKAIGNYELVEVLGSGSTGVVYKARDTVLNREVAVKVMDSTLARGEDFVRRFRSEAKALARLQTPHIVTIFSLQESDLGVYIVMEYLDGMTLSERLRESGPLAPEEAVGVFAQALDALHHAHGAGIVHRDVKPQNIMLLRGGGVKVMDFGLAKIQQPTTSTMTMGTEGTLYYMSPEAVKALSNVDSRGDIYSLGITLYEAVTGHVPFPPDADDFAVRQAIIEGNLQPPDRAKPDLPDFLVEVIRRATERDPARRFQTARDMIQSLQQERQAEPPVDYPREDVSIEPYAEPPRRSVRKRKITRTTAAIAAGVVAAFAVIVFLFREQETSRQADGGGAVLVGSDPPGAQVTVNGEYVGNTPVRTNAPAGEAAHVTLTQDGFAVVDTSIVPVAGEEVYMMVQLRRAQAAGTHVRGRIEIASTPVGATVWLNGNAIGNTPVTADDVEPGEYSLQIRKDGFKPWSEENIHVEAGKTVTQAASLSPVDKGTLTLHVVPEGSVELDGGEIEGLSNGTVDLAVGPGRKTLVFRHPMYGEVRETVTIEENAHTELTCFFESAVTIQTLDEWNEPTWGTISVNGVPTPETTPRELLLGPGTYTITATRSGFETLEGEQQVTIEAVVANRRPEIPLVFHLKEEHP